MPFARKPSNCGEVFSASAVSPARNQMVSWPLLHAVGDTRESEVQSSRVED